MSRFSKKEAEQAGWQFVHESDEEQVVKSGTQGRIQTTPPSIRAEKDLGPGLGIINAQGETEGLVLEQIAFQEAQLEAAAAPKGTVIVSDGKDGTETITEEEYQERLKERDLAAATFEVGAEVDSGELAREAEEARTEPPQVKTNQFELDPLDVAVDSPGQTGTGTLVVRAGEESIRDVALRREEEKTTAEMEKSLEPSRAPEGGLTPHTTIEGVNYPEPERVTEVKEPAEEPEQKAPDTPQATTDQRYLEEEETVEISATPAAEELAETEKIDISQIEGSGKGGRVTKDDVEAAISEKD